MDTSNFKVKTIRRAIELVFGSKGRRLTNLSKITRAKIEELMEEGKVLNQYKNEIVEKAEELKQEEIKNEPERKRMQKERRERRKGHIQIVEQHVAYDD